MSGYDCPAKECALESRLSETQRRSISAVREAAEGAASLSQFLVLTLAALEEYLGFAESAFMLTLAGPPLCRQRAYAGVKHGSPPYVLEEYFERWSAADALASRAARAAFVHRGWATISDVYAQLEPAERRFVDEFLRRIRASGQLSFRLPGSWTDGYVTVMGPDEFSERDRLVIAALVPELGELLRAHLPRGLNGALSARESQVAELVTAGFSNREIAAALGVEEDTVKKHLSRAMAKLGFERRTQLAVAWATGRSLDPPRPARLPAEA